MSTYGLATADRMTHVKIVMVSLIACVAVVCVGKTARPELPAKNARMEVRTQVMVADRPVLWTSADRVAIR
jgi:hypothetical protein